jgi:hypothetical protein
LWFAALRLGEVMSEELKPQVAELARRLDTFASEHAEFRLSHNSRRGVQGIQGAQGEPGVAGPPADPQQVAILAAEIVKKDFRFETLVTKFQSLLSELEGEVVAVKAALQFAVITELKQAGVIDAEGRAILGPQGPAGLQGPAGPIGSEGPQGLAGNDGVDGRDGRDGQDGKSVVGPQGPAGADSQVPGPRGERGELGPEGLQGLPGEGLDRAQVIELVRDMKRRGTI